MENGTVVFIKYLQQMPNTLQKTNEQTLQASFATETLIAFVAALLTAGISWIIFPFFGGKIIRDSYLRKGWIELDEPE